MSAAQWGELVSAWKASGVTAEAFASKHGVAGKTLRWWRTELAKRARNEPAGGTPSRRSPATVSGVALARVVRPGEGPTSATARGGVAVLVGGARVVVEPGFDGRLLCEVVRALAEAR
jgi:transposase-like protein